MAKAAVAYASVAASVAPTTVRLARPAAGCPVCGLMMCAPRSATPEVATAKSRPATTSASDPGRSGSAIPTRHGWPEPRSPTHWTSPPPLTLCSAEPATVSMAAARSMAQPFTYPDGSNRPPGVVVKYPPLSALTSAQAARTWASSGAQSASGSDPRPNRLTSLSSRYGENVASTQCSHWTARPRTGPAQSGASKDTTVPITGSACRSRRVRWSEAAVERALQRVDVTRAGVAGPGYRVDLRALRRERLADQAREGELADLDVVDGVGRLLEDRHLDDLAALDDQLDLHRAVHGVGHVTGDRGLTRGQSAGRALEFPGYRRRGRRRGRGGGRRR